VVRRDHGDAALARDAGERAPDHDVRLAVHDVGGTSSRSLRE
jgi:hypothetical protein